MKSSILLFSLFFSLSSASQRSPKGSKKAGANVDICHIPPGDPDALKTIGVGPDAVNAHLNAGSLLGPCESHCLDLCPGPLSKKKCKKLCGDVEQTPVVAVTGRSAEIQVRSCDKSSVEVDGTSVDSIVVGSMFLYNEGTTSSPCGNCSPLFRKVESVVDGSGTSKILTTSFVTFGEILGPDIGTDTADLLIEPAIGCSHTSGRRQLELDAHQQHRSLVSFPRTCAQWQRKNLDGQCTYTNCIVGLDGDPYDCFSCGTECDNGCGAENSTLTWDGNAVLFDFGEPCCIHDHCYSSSTFSQVICDFQFYSDMANQCTGTPQLILTLLGPTGRRVSDYSSLACYNLASIFYAIVAINGGEAAADAQRKQKAHEQKDICVAKCPSTTTSGGQGTTILRIDLLKTRGTFPISYQMYSIEDQLYIEYEGTRIFDTGGLVFGSQSSTVSFSGTNTVIDVTLFAPLDDTRWDLFIGCAE